MKKFIGAALLASAAIGGLSTAAHAEEGSFSANVALTSNYVWRGLTQSDGDAAIQGGFDYTNGIFYAGTWGSSVNFGALGPEDLATMELDVYAGLTPSVGPVTFDVGVVGYFYPGSTDAGNELDFWEGLVGASFAASDQLTLGASVYYSPEFSGENGESLYGEINAAFAFSDAFSVSGAYGNQDVDLLGDYSTWNLGGTVSLHGFGIDFRYWDTQDTGLDEQFSVTVSRAL
jgi:uncharacterized protein (TIGR02001 family)